MADGLVCNDSGVPLYDQTTGKLIQGSFVPVIKYDSKIQTDLMMKYDSVIQTPALVYKYDSVVQMGA